MLPDTTPPDHDRPGPADGSDRPATRCRNAAERASPTIGDAGVPPLPTGPDADDALAALYGWPAPTGTPWLRANMIASLDGGATLDGRSAGLGNAADEHLFAVLRDLAEVILVGSGTARAEQYGGVRFDAERRPAACAGACPRHRRPSPWSPAAAWTRSSPLFTDTVTPPIVITTEAGRGQGSGRDSGDHLRATIG